MGKEETRSSCLSRCNKKALCPISSFIKCGNLREARQMFDKMPQRDAVSWNSIITGYAQHRLRKDAVQLFSSMQREGLASNKATIIAILTACDSHAALVDGKWIHSQIRDTEFESDVSVGNALITMYGKCGSLEDAENVFEKMPEWDKTTFLNILAACGSQGSLVKGKRMHDRIVNSGQELGVVVENALISMYDKCGSLEFARRMFDEMVERDLVSWNALIAAYSHNGEGKAALQLLTQMQQEGVMPNKVTFVSSVDACAGQGAATQGKWIHACIVGCEFEFDVVLRTALVHMYGKCDSIDDALFVFDKTPERDVASWNAVITVCAQHDESKDALFFFDQMQQEGVMPDKITFVSSLSACTNQTVLFDGKRLYARIVCCGFASDVVIGNAIISMHGKCGGLEDAIQLLNMMPCQDNVTFINMFSACANEAALIEGRQIHSQIMGSAVEANVVVGNAIINFYGKCGSLDIARSFFNKMPERNVVSWNAMMSAYAQNGQGKIAIKLFSEMISEGVMPNDISFVCILCACSHNGLVDGGCQFFLSMTRDFGIEPTADHYNCMIDLFGRAGMLDDAEALISRMPFKPSVVTWTTLLGACRNQVDVERGEHAARCVFNLSPRKTSAYVTLSNLYTAAGRPDDAAMIINKMREKGLKSQVGYSSIEVRGKVYRFIADDQSHTTKEEIYAELWRLNIQLQEAGYTCGTERVLYDLEGEHMQSHHSEKLAIAFGLISTPPGNSLLITKNLRVCHDCHSATKLISRIAAREIILRDAVRFHYMKHGVCSCADYW